MTHCDEHMTGADQEHTFVCRPAPRAVVIASWGWLIGLGVMGVTGVWLVGSGREPWTGQRMAVAAIVGVLAVLAWQAIILRCEKYALDGKRVRARGGVFRVLTVDAALGKVTNVLVRRTVLERVLGLGTVGVFTAADGGEVVWRWIDCPEHAAERVREAVARNSASSPHHQFNHSNPGLRRASGPASGEVVDTHPDLRRRGSSGPASRREDDRTLNKCGEPELRRKGPSGPASEEVAVDTAGVGPINVGMADAARANKDGRMIPILGIAGGIGAGKSTVARAFERLGCHVIESDVRAKAALELPRVREQLVEWWGKEILGEDGRVERAKIAQIIFSSPEERARLEALVHPIVRQDRARMIQEAVAAGAAGVIVDAPLLYEVGIDKECDAVVFVDAPREERVRRVMATRGWDEAELARREATQMDVDEKRRRSRFVVENGAEGVDLEAQAGAILAELAASPPTKT